jgi:hypothetical protein
MTRGVLWGTYGFRKSIPVIMREKICNPDPDMYIIIAFIGILNQVRKWEILRDTFLQVQWPLPMPS